MLPKRLVNLTGSLYMMLFLPLPQQLPPSTHAGGFRPLLAFPPEPPAQLWLPARLLVPIAPLPNTKGKIQSSRREQNSCLFHLVLWITWKTIATTQLYTISNRVKFFLVTRMSSGSAEVVKWAELTLTRRVNPGKLWPEWLYMYLEQLLYHS